MWFRLGLSFAVLGAVGCATLEAAQLDAEESVLSQRCAYLGSYTWDCTTARSASADAWQEARSIGAVIFGDGDSIRARQLSRVRVLLLDRGGDLAGRYDGRQVDFPRDGRLAGSIKIYPSDPGMPPHRTAFCHELGHANEHAAGHNLFALGQCAVTDEHFCEPEATKPLIERCKRGLAR